jgi:hypothetical protein
MINVVSLGAGKQSSYMLLNALEGKFRFKVDLVVFDDTGCEPRYVYGYLDWLENYIMTKYGMPIAKVQAGNLMQDVIDYIEGKRKRVAMLPLRLRKTNLIDNGILPRQCTADYKIAPMRRFLQKYRKLKDENERVRLWIGISVDEVERIKESPVKYIEHYYPLIENRISIDQIVNWFTVNKLPEPGKSACLICPFHSFDYWSMLKRFQRADFETACKFDDIIRDYPGLRRKAYLSNQLKPLRDVDFSKHPSLFPDLIEECHGMCGL